MLRCKILGLNFIEETFDIFLRTFLISDKSYKVKVKLKVKLKVKVRLEKFQLTSIVLTVLKGKKSLVQKLM